MSVLSAFSKERRKRAAVVTAIILVVVSVPLLFENCSPTSQNGYQNATSVALTAPFAYDIALDTVAYMSCNGAQSPNNYLYTFRAGAFNTNAGLRISPGFWTAASDLSTADKISSIEQSTLSAGAYPTMSIRSPLAPKVGMQSYFLSTPNAASESTFGGISPIDNGTILQQLFNGVPDSWNYSFNVGGNISPFVATIDFTTAYAENSVPGQYDAQTVRDQVSTGGGYLAAAFTNQNLDVPGTYGGAIPQGNLTNIDGVGFQFTFGAGKSLNGAETISGATRVVTAVSEVNLSTMTSTGSTWTCPYQIFIVRPGADAANCPKGTAAVPAAVSNMLPGWSINMNLNGSGRACAVPPTGLCYGINSATTIDYNGSASCNPATNTCPHYVSICTRLP